MEIQNYLLSGFLLLMGILLQFRSVIEWYLKVVNELRGSKTEITKETIRAWRVFGILFIVLGIGLFLLLSTQKPWLY